MSRGRVRSAAWVERRLLPLLIVLLLLAGCAFPGEAQVTSEPTVEWIVPTQMAVDVTPQPPATPGDRNTPGPPVVVETSAGVPLSASATLGELNVEYPVRMDAGTSNLVVLRVHIPAALASLSPLEIERVVVPEDAPVVAGALSQYQATILVGATMRIELHSLTFQIEDLYPALQDVDLDQVNQATLWSWEIRAPDTPGKHVVTVRAYLGDAARPVWIRSLEIEVVGPAVALSPTPPPSHPQDSPPPVWGWVLAILVGAGGLAGVGWVVARRVRPGARPPVDQAGDLAPVRQLLLDAFGAEELRRLCQDDERLRPVLYDLDEEPSPNEVVDAVLNHCMRGELLEYLLAVVKEKNPARYAEFERARSGQTRNPGGIL